MEAVHAHCVRLCGVLDGERELLVLPGDPADDQDVGEGHLLVHGRAVLVELLLAAEPPAADVALEGQIGVGLRHMAVKLGLGGVVEGDQ